MDVQDLRPGDPVWVMWPGHDEGPVTDISRAEFLDYDREGIRVTSNCLPCLIPWTARHFVADPRTGAAIPNPWDDRLPATIPEPE